MDTLTVEEVSKLYPVNETDETKALSIAKSIVEGVFSAPALLYHDLHNMAITGSHRIRAAQILVELDEESDYELGYSDIELSAIAVDDYIEAYCEEEDVGMEHLPYDSLREIFEDTDLAHEVSQNEEW